MRTTQGNILRLGWMRLVDIYQYLLPLSLAEQKLKADASLSASIQARKLGTQVTESSWASRSAIVFRVKVAFDIWSMQVNEIFVYLFSEKGGGGRDRAGDNSQTFTWNPLLIQYVITSDAIHAARWMRGNYRYQVGLRSRCNLNAHVGNHAAT